MIDILAENGLRRGERGLKVIMMCEIPSNALLADKFLEHVDGFSIGSNDMTQLTLGLDRDSGLIAHLFDERNEAVKALLAMAIAAARKAGKYVGSAARGHPITRTSPPGWSSRGSTRCPSTRIPWSTPGSIWPSSTRRTDAGCTAPSKWRPRAPFFMAEPDATGPIWRPDMPKWRAGACFYTPLHLLALQPPHNGRASPLHGVAGLPPVAGRGSRAVSCQHGGQDGRCHRAYRTR